MPNSYQSAECSHAKPQLDLEEICKPNCSCPKCGVIIIDDDSDDSVEMQIHGPNKNSIECIDLNDLISEESSNDTDNYDYLLRLNNIDSRQNKNKTQVKTIIQNRSVIPMEDLMTSESESESEEENFFNNKHKRKPQKLSLDPILDSGIMESYNNKSHSYSLNYFSDSPVVKPKASISAIDFYQDTTVNSNQNVKKRTPPKSLASSPKKRSIINDENKAQQLNSQRKLQQQILEKRRRQIVEKMRYDSVINKYKKSGIRENMMKNFHLTKISTSSSVVVSTVHNQSNSIVAKRKAIVGSPKRPLPSTVTKVKSPILRKAPPPVAVRTNSNRMEGLLNDMIADLNDKQFAKPKPSVASKPAPLRIRTKVSPTSTSTITSSTNTVTSPQTKFDRTNYSVSNLLAAKRAQHQQAVTRRLISPKRKPNKVRSPDKPNKIRSPVNTNHLNSNRIMEAAKFRPKINQQENFNKKLPFNADPILLMILKWNTNWLHEYNDQASVPPLVSQLPIIPLSLSYESIEKYFNTYVPMLLYETWSLVYESYSKSIKSQFTPEIIILNYNANHELIILNGQMVKPKSDSFSINEGDLVVIELIIQDESNFKKKLSVFGYISELKFEDIISKTIVPPQLRVPKGLSELLKYEIKIMKRSLRINCNEIMKIKTIYYLRPMLRQFELINSFELVKIHKDILKPREMSCQFVIPNNTSLLIDQYNEHQSKAIVGCFEAVSRPYVIPKLLLIQGPPGTGKTHTLIGIIKYLYLNWEEQTLPRILICAPSNGAVDEVARRLYPLRKFLRTKANRDLRLVRVGMYDQVHQDVKKITVENLTTTNVKVCEENQMKNAQKKQSEIESKIAKLDQELANCRANGEKGKVKIIEQKMSSLAKDLNRVNNNIKEVNTKNIKSDIMHNVDVVFSTLNSCRQAAIELLYKKYGPGTFNCVIVDEASQCTEPEILMPLSYGMTKMILIGDPLQLPATVISKTAGENKFGRSLFERFYKYFQQNHKSDVILMLNEQYRMHKEICEFPSKIFYDGKLLTSNTIADGPFPIVPYVVIDLVDTVENKADPTNKFNELEAKFVIKLISVIDNIVEPQVTVGIITPYQGQKQLLNEKLKNTEFKIKPEVNTIDGFQGQERDIIILSLVRAHERPNTVGFLNSTQRMNVALTRAKHSMILCISANTLKVNQHWNKLIDDANRRRKYYKMNSSSDQNKITMIIKKR